ncbi:MAG: Fe-S cluster assembly protein SufD [Spirochaetota bacterium]|nr:Fe-S cluster assembly protein SufD [Spirochaetota bacterium]
MTALTSKELSNKEEQLTREYQNHRAQAKSPLSELNERGFRRFTELKLPLRKHEMYTYVNLKDILSQPFHFSKEALVTPELNLIASNTYPDCAQSILVFLNGEYSETLSNTDNLNDKITISPLDKAISDPHLADYLYDKADREDDVFASLNSAFIRGGLYIKIPAGLKLSQEIQILFLNGASGQSLSPLSPRLIIEAESMSESKIITKSINTGSGILDNSQRDFILADGATMTHADIQDDHISSYRFNKYNVTLSKDSRFLSTTAASGGSLVRYHHEAHLKAEGADLSINGISVLAHEEQIHHYVRVHHEAPRSVSQQMFRNIIQDAAHSSVDTTVIVHEPAQQTDSKQLINNLMLSDDGKADTKPNLIIHADDVKCAHGATVGQIAGDQLFYLKSRGLSEHEARSLLIASFAKTIIERIDSPTVRSQASDMLLGKLEDKNV